MLKCLLFTLKHFFFRNGIYRHGFDLDSRSRLDAAISAAASPDFFLFSDQPEIDTDLTKIETADLPKIKSDLPEIKAALLETQTDMPGIEILSFKLENILSTEGLIVKV